MFFLPSSAIHLLFSEWLEYIDLVYIYYCLNYAERPKYCNLVSLFGQQTIFQAIQKRDYVGKIERSWLSDTAGIEVSSRCVVDFMKLPTAIVDSCLETSIPFIISKKRSALHMEALLNLIRVSSSLRMVVIKFSSVGVRWIVDLFGMKHVQCSVRIVSTKKIGQHPEIIVDYNFNTNTLIIGDMIEAHVYGILCTIDRLDSINLMTTHSLLETFPVLYKYRKTLREMHLPIQLVWSEELKFFPKLTSLWVKQLLWTESTNLRNVASIRTKHWNLCCGALELIDAVSMDSLTHALIVPITSLSADLRHQQCFVTVCKLVASSLLSLELIWAVMEPPGTLKLLIYSACRLQKLKITCPEEAHHQLPFDWLDIVAWAAESRCHETLIYLRCERIPALNYNHRIDSLHLLTALEELEIDINEEESCSTADYERLVSALVQLPYLTAVELRPVLTKQLYINRVTVDYAKVIHFSWLELNLPEQWWNFLYLDDTSVDVNTVRQLLTRESAFSLSVGELRFPFLYETPLSIKEFYATELMSVSELTYMLTNWPHVDVIHTPYFTLSRKNNEVNINCAGYKPSFALLVDYCSAIVKCMRVDTLWLDLSKPSSFDIAVDEEFDHALSDARTAISIFTSVNAVHIIVTNRNTAVADVLQLIPYNVRLISVQRIFERYRTDGQTVDVALRRATAKALGISIKAGNNEDDDNVAQAEPDLLSALTNFIRNREQLRIVKLFIADAWRRNILKRQDFDECRRLRLKIELLAEPLECTLMEPQKIQDRMEFTDIDWTNIK